MKPEVRRYPDLEELNRDAAAEICDWARRCVAERGVFHLVLSGGRTPERLYERLSQPPYDVRIPWSQVHLFLGDERCGPVRHADSNYAMAHRVLMSRVAAPPEHVHRPPSEVDPPEAAAAAWEADLRALFPEGPPRFDLILLGVGADGHTASLFPGDPALAVADRWTAAVSEPRGIPPAPRVTLALPVINRARRVMFLVSGSGKAAVVREILSDPIGAADRYPAAMVRPEGRLLWLLDGSFV